MEIKETELTTKKKSSKDIVTLMEKEWPVMTAEFRKLQREQYELFLHKQHDYGPGNISVGTQLQTPEEIKLSLTGVLGYFIEYFWTSSLVIKTFPASMKIPRLVFSPILR